ncbi:hypothetical protein So717_36580 [Roseobacter cerasinus]|uniref:Integrase catalytic domain-containing protein n=1 Tax=Roseobacter cerasinus TaxID=2602289 RepID=A0A640VY82_9RHOB|nr:hypothetical protein So717_36580 [Roseobacter cerasinus]
MRLFAQAGVKTVKAEDVPDALDLAPWVSGCDQVRFCTSRACYPDNGASYISATLADWLEDRQVDHVHGAPYHPQIRGAIQRRHHTLKNRAVPENHHLPGDPRRQLDAFADHDNHKRYHESLQT